MSAGELSSERTHGTSRILPGDAFRAKSSIDEGYGWTCMSGQKESLWIQGFGDFDKVKVLITCDLLDKYSF